MGIYKAEIKDFFVLKSNLSLTFSTGVNVIIGENGTGKTTLLKVIYMMCDFAKDRHNANHNDIESAIDEVNKRGWKSFTTAQFVNIEPYFPNIQHGKGIITGFADDKGNIFDKNSQINLNFDYGKDSLTRVTIFGIHDECSAVLIPTNDMLSHSKGLLALDRERQLPFDKTYIDILSKAQLPVTRDITHVAGSVIDKIKKIIGGEVVYENDIFYVVNDVGEKTPFNLEASGYRKFGLLWKLLRNGLLEAGGILFWDEPENSLNPELVPVLVDILFLLSRQGVQVFLATHDYNIMKYFSVKKISTDKVAFHSLQKTDNGIVWEREDDYDLLTNNSIVNADIQMVKDEIGGDA